MTSACFSKGHTGFSRNATLVATVNPPALAGGVFNLLSLVYINCNQGNEMYAGVTVFCELFLVNGEDYGARCKRREGTCASNQK